MYRVWELYYMLLMSCVLWQLYVQSLGVVLYVTGEFVLWQLYVQSLGVVLYVTGEYVLWQLYVQSLGVVLYVLCLLYTSPSPRD